MSELPDSCVLRGCDEPWLSYDIGSCEDPNDLPVIGDLTGTLITALPVGVAATMTVSVTGSGLEWQWEVVVGSLPTGMALTDDGEQTATISGTPSATGSYSFTLSAVNGWGIGTTKAYTVTVI